MTAAPLTIDQYSDTQPVASRFFQGAFQSHSMAHGFVFRGPDASTMYRFALDLAKVLNCANSTGSQEACGECKECRWIDQNAHPAVMTVSRFTFLANDDGVPLSEDELQRQAKKDGQPKQIKAGQVRYLLSQLAISSPYRRVVIFTDAEEKPASTQAAIVAPYEWRMLDANAEKSFHPRPLDAKIFNAASANRFLKTLEEPPPNTVFIFITDAEENLLETIVSRCQTVPFVRDFSAGADAELSDSHRQFLDRLMAQIAVTRDFYALVEDFQAFFIHQESLTSVQAIEIFQDYLHEKLHADTLTQASFLRIANLLKEMEETKKMLEARVNPEQTLNQLFFTLTR